MDERGFFGLNFCRASRGISNWLAIIRGFETQRRQIWSQMKLHLPNKTHYKKQRFCFLLKDLNSFGYLSGSSCAKQKRDFARVNALRSHEETRI